MTANLRWQTCSVCGDHFRGTPRKLGVNVFCGPDCARTGKRAILRATAILTAFQPSPLNVAISAAYDRCRAAGTHRPGQRTTGYRVWRGYDFCMAICDTCSVPIPDEAVGFRLGGSLSEDAA